jgi:hypothetical protein
VPPDGRLQKLGSLPFCGPLQGGGFLFSDGSLLWNGFLPYIGSPKTVRYLTHRDLIKRYLALKDKYQTLSPIAAA